MLDQLIVEFDKALRTLFVAAQTVRAVPGGDAIDAELSPEETKNAAALMRVNHVGEICAQALYRGQALACQSDQTRLALAKAANEETEHLAWTEQRVKALGGRTSLLNPVWYLGSLAIGVVAGKCGDRWSLGFLAETERQVEAHLDSHLGRLSESDSKSRAIVEQMKLDERGHAQMAVDLGARELPAQAKAAMRLAGRVMTRTANFL